MIKGVTRIEPPPEAAFPLLRWLLFSAQQVPSKRDVPVARLSESQRIYRSASARLSLQCGSRIKRYEAESTLDFADLRSGECKDYENCRSSIASPPSALVCGESYGVQAKNLRLAVASASFFTRVDRKR